MSLTVSAAKILIADDDAIFRSLMTDVFTSHGMTVVSAGDGREVIGLAEAEDPDIALVDVRMPMLSGFEVTEAIRRHPRLSLLPLVLVTALDDSNDRDTGLRLGADDLVVKPVKHADIVRRAVDCLRQSRYQRVRAMHAGLDWLTGNGDSGFLWLDRAGGWSGENAVARRLLHLHLGPAGEPGETLVAHLARHFSLETKALWQDWPSPTVQNTPRLLVRGAGSARPVVLEVSIVPANFGPQTLVKIDDVTTAYQQKLDSFSFHSALRSNLAAPMNSLASGIELLGTKAADPALVGTIRKASAQLQSAMNRLQNFASISAHPPGQQLSLSGLASIIDDVNERVLSNRLWCVMPSQLSLRSDSIPLSPAQVDFILTELITNAVKFHPRQQPFVQLEVTIDNGVRLTVKSDTTPIPDHLSPLLLTPYFQAQRSRPAGIPGAGMGLALVAQVVWQAGGRCIVNNSESGVEVEISFPSVGLVEASVQ